MQFLSRTFHFCIFIAFICNVSINTVAQAGPPTITSVDHARMPVGGRQCVNGTGFGPWEGNSTFTLNGTVLNTAITWSDTQFCFQVPATTPAGTATVQLTTVDGTSNGLSFTLTPPPAITSITPTRGAPGTQVTITGTNFGATQGNSYLKFDSTIPVVS